MGLIWLGNQHLLVAAKTSEASPRSAAEEPGLEGCVQSEQLATGTHRCRREGGGGGRKRRKDKLLPETDCTALDGPLQELGTPF